MQSGGANCSESPSRIPKTGVLTALFYYIVSPIALLLFLIFFLVECSVLRSTKQG